jgi:hypothetical protein
MWGLMQQLDELRKENTYLKNELAWKDAAHEAARARYLEDTDRIIQQNKRLRTALEEVVGALNTFGKVETINDVDFYPKLDAAFRAGILAEKILTEKFPPT